MRLDISMFTFGKVRFTIDADTRTRKMTYRGKWQTLEVFHNFAGPRGEYKNKFYILGLNDYDRMEVRTTEDLRAVAQLMGYDDEILGVIDQLIQNEK